MSLTASFDGSTLTRIIFNEPVTLDQAMGFLWGRRPQLLRETPDAFGPDPAERATDGRQTRFLIRGDCAAHLIQIALPSNLQREYARRGGQRSGVVGAAGSAEDGIPAWVPPDLRDRILRHELPAGATRFRGRAPRPWGDIIVWQRRRGPFAEVELFLEFPTNLSFYLDIAGGHRGTARMLQTVYVRWNNDMASFVEGPRRMSPSEAYRELKRINDQLFREVIKSAVALMGMAGTINAAVSLMRANTRLVTQMAEESGAGGNGFGRLREDYNVQGGAVERQTPAGSWRQGPRAGGGRQPEPARVGAGARDRLPTDPVDPFGDTLREIPLTRRIPGTRPPRIPVTRNPGPDLPDEAIAPAIPRPATRDIFARLREIPHTQEELTQAEALRRFQTVNHNAAERLDSCFMGPNMYSVYEAEWRALGGLGRPPAFGFRVLGPDGEILYTVAFFRDPAVLR